MEPIDGMDAYEITSDNGKVVLRGNNTISHWRRRSTNI